MRGKADAKHGGHAIFHDVAPVEDTDTSTASQARALNPVGTENLVSLYNSRHKQRIAFSSNLFNLDLDLDQKSVLLLAGRGAGRHQASTRVNGHPSTCGRQDMASAQERRFHAGTRSFLDGTSRVSHFVYRDRLVLADHCGGRKDDGLSSLAKRISKAVGMSEKL